MSSTQTHVEPFVHLAEVTSDGALVAWGAFWFQRDSPQEQWRIVPHDRLEQVAGRQKLIGHDAEPYGAAIVEVLDLQGRVVASAGTDERAWVHVTGLQPDTPYRYRVLVDGEEWAAGERWDWAPADRGGYDLLPAGRSYDLRLHTFPADDAHVPLTFAVLGDYGVGIESDAESSRRQRRVAEVVERLVVDRAARFVVTTGDNVYEGERGRIGTGSGATDGDWWSSFYAPYRYTISRVPIYPALGNHDSSDSEQGDDRQQMYDNFHTASRFAGNDDRSSVDPGLHYVVRWGADVELVAVDTSQASDLEAHRYFQNPKHQRWLQEAFHRPGPRWRIPYSHHPAYCAGPHHGNDEEVIETLVPLYRETGVRVVLAGHEHNFQTSHVDGVLHVVTGAGGNLREDLPTGFDEARTTSWAVQAHAALVEIEGDELRLTPFSGVRADGSLERMTAQTPEGAIVAPPFSVSLAAPSPRGPAADASG